jgi:hypothetical protein
VATVDSNGLATGPDAFAMKLFNLGKNPVKMKGEGVVFRPISQQERQGLLTALGPLLDATPPGTVSTEGYCLEQKQRPPSEGEFYALAPAETQQQFAPMRRILDASQRLFDRGALTPDSDPDAYFHATRQWAVWTAQEGYDQQAFGEALVEQTKKNAEAAGYPWSDALDRLAHGMVANRWQDVVKVLDEAGLEMKG